MSKIIFKRPPIVKLGIVTKTRRIGRAELYKLNSNSPVVKKLIELDRDISKKLMQEEINKQKLKVKVMAWILK